MNTGDLHAYCLEIATLRQTGVGRVDAGFVVQKQKWLRAAGKQLVQQTPALMAANQPDLDAYAQFRPDRSSRRSAAIDRPADRGHGAALEEFAALPDPVGEIISSIDPAQRPGSAQGPRAAGRRLFHLRVAAKRHRRRRRHLRQKRQRRHPPRRQGSGPLEPRDRRPAGRGLAEAGLPADAVQLVATTDRAPWASCCTADSRSTWPSRAAARG